MADHCFPIRESVVLIHAFLFYTAPFVLDGCGLLPVGARPSLRPPRPFDGPLSPSLSRYYSVHPVTLARSSTRPRSSMCLSIVVMKMCCIRSGVNVLLFLHDCSLTDQRVCRKRAIIIIFIFAVCSFTCGVIVFKKTAWCVLVGVFILSNFLNVDSAF